MIYSEATLGKILRNMYDNAPPKGKKTMIFLFGVKYGHIIEENNFAISRIVDYSGIRITYQKEVREGINLAQYVEIKPNMNTF